MQEEEITGLFPVHRREQVEAMLEKVSGVEEIRVRVGWPLLVWDGGADYFYNSKSRTTEQFNDRSCLCNADRITVQDIREMLSYITRYSLYAFEAQLKHGFVTVRGGHRIGISGQVILEGEQVKNFSYITFLNIRVARQIKRCAAGILPYIRSRGTIYNTMILSPPGGGKTTLLRDCIRCLSYGEEGYPGIRVAVADERSELAACFHGVPQNDLGPRTDILDGCGKAEGIRMLLRSMAPQVIAVDELGEIGDYQAVEKAFSCGCNLIGTMHAKSLEQLRQKEGVNGWMKMHQLQRIVLVERTRDSHRNYRIYDEEGVQLC